MTTHADQEQAVSRPTPVQIAAAKVHVKGDQRLQRETPPEILAILEAAHLQDENTSRQRRRVHRRP